MRAASLVLITRWKNVLPIADASIFVTSQMQNGKGLRKVLESLYLKSSLGEDKS